MTALRRNWTFILAIIFGSATTYLASPDLWNSVSTQVIIFFSIQAGAILPAMTASIGFLKKDNFDLPMFERYYAAVEQLMTFLKWLFVLDILGVILIVFGGIVKWDLTIPQTTWTPELDAAWVLCWLASVVVIWAVLRTIPFLQGVLSLFRTHANLSRQTIQRRDTEGAAALLKDAPSDRGSIVPKGYGRVRSSNDLRRRN